MIKETLQCCTLVVIIVFIIWLMGSCILPWMFPKYNGQNEYFHGNVTTDIHMIYNEEGVYYYLTDEGSIAPAYNADGTLMLVDNGD